METFKKGYDAPAIKKLGAVADLTEGGSGGGTDTEGGTGSCYSGTL